MKTTFSSIAAIHIGLSDKGEGIGIDLFIGGNNEISIESISQVKKN